MPLNSDRTRPGVLEVVTILGFGDDRENGNLQNVLNMADVLAFSDADCIASYPQYLVNPELMICAQADGKDS